MSAARRFSGRSRQTSRNFDSEAAVLHFFTGNFSRAIIMQLSNSDFKRVLFSIDLLNSGYEPETLPQRTMDAVRALVATDVVSFEGFGQDSHYQGPLWYAPLESVSDEMLTAMGEYVSDHPCFDGIAAKRLEDVVKVSDFMTLERFKRSTIYNEFFRHLGTDRQIVAPLHISRELMITCSLCRPVKDFARRDCSAMTLLAPHLTAAFRHAKFIRRLKSESDQLQNALELARLAVLTLDGELNPQIVTPTAAALFRKFFDRDAVSLPADLKDYVRHHRRVFTDDEFYLPPKPFEIQRHNARLVVRLNFQSSSRTVILFLEEIPVSPNPNYSNSGLTGREREVLFWVGRGKTDGEIGTILKISARTVQKHMENIFNKLGVETRTAAASAMFEKSDK